MTVAHEREVGGGDMRARGFQPVRQPPRADEEAGRPWPVLVLDLGAHTRWALWWDDDHVRTGVDDYSRWSRRESLGMQVLKFRRWLRETLQLARPGLVVYTRGDEVLAHKLEGVLLAEVEGRIGYCALVWSPVAEGGGP